MTLKAESIHRYHPVDFCFLHGKKTEKALRAFVEKEKSILLAVDIASLRSGLFPAKEATPVPCPNDSRYFRLLHQASTPPHPLQDDGITHTKNGLYLTTDLCPSSKKGFEKRLYQAIIRRFPHPVPVTLFITKRWIDKHPAAFRTLRQWDTNGSLAITWGNHTAWHHYHPGKPLKENFILSPEENLTQDVLELEKTLLNRGVTPSVYFRFPGLVSNEEAVQIVTGLGLIPIGTDAWLAKGQKPKVGSIILVHGNRNEPKGVDRFLKMLERGEIERLHPLSEIDVQPSNRVTEQ